MRFFLLLLIPLFSCLGAEKFSLRYFYDKEDENLSLIKMQWLSDQRAIAIGVLEEPRRVQGVTLQTGDGGNTWQIQKFKEIPQDLFFLDDSFGWIATDKGVWHTEEGGRSWKKLRSQKGILAIHFHDSRNGILAGVPKLIMKTSDGGRKWTKVNEADSPSTRKENTAYTVISFFDQKVGQVIGFSSRSRNRKFPDWMDPEDALKQKQRPAALLLLATSDAGNSWRVDTASIFGRVIQARFLPDRTSLTVFKFDEAFQFPGEVFHLGSSKGDRVYREKGKLPTDVLVSGGGKNYLGVIELPTQLPNAPIPGRVQVYRSDAKSLTHWSEIPVDYRAVANEIHLAEKPDGSIWAITDHGMILELRD